MENLIFQVFINILEVTMFLTLPGIWTRIIMCVVHIK